MVERLRRLQINTVNDKAEESAFVPREMYVGIRLTLNKSALHPARTHTRSSHRILAWNQNLLLRVGTKPFVHRVVS